MRSLLLLIVTFLPGINLYSQDSQWSHFAYGNIIYDVALEGERYVWAGSSTALYRFDRETNERQVFFPSVDGLHGFGVYSICVAPDGTKWFGGENGGLTRFDGTDWTHFSESSSGEVLERIGLIKVAPNGDVWFIAGMDDQYDETKIYRYDGVSVTDMQTIFSPDNSFANRIRSFDIAPNGDVLVVSNQKIQRFDGTSVVQVFTQQDMGIGSYDYFRFALFDVNDNIVCIAKPNPVSSNSGSLLKALRYNGTNWINETNLLNPPAIGIRNFFRDPQGNLWLSMPGNISGVVYKYDGNTWQRWNWNQLANANQASILLAVDSLGNWFTSKHKNSSTLYLRNQRGLYEFDGSNWKIYDTEIHPLDETGTTDVEFDCDNNVWVSGEQRECLAVFDGDFWKQYRAAHLGLFYLQGINQMDFSTISCDLWLLNGYYFDSDIDFTRYDGEDFTNFELPEITSTDEILTEANGTIWVNGYQKLGRYDGVVWQWFDELNSPIGESIRDIALGDGNVVWVAEEYKVHKFENGNWTTFNQSNSPLVGNNIIYWIYVDGNNNLWVDNGNSSFMFDGSNWSELLVSNTNSISQMAQDSLNEYWFLTYGDGVYKYDGNALINYNVTNSGLGTNEVSNIKIDANNNKWFVHETGISVFNENGLPDNISGYAKVHGRVYFDANQDSTFNLESEFGIPGMSVMLLPDSLISFTDPEGFYSFTPTSGNHQIVLQPQSPFQPTSPTSLNLAMGNLEQGGFNFGMWSDELSDSVSIFLTPSQTLCSQESIVWTTVSNHRPDSVNAIVYLELDSLVEFESALPAPTSIIGNMIVWEQVNLNPFESRSFTIIVTNPDASFTGEEIHFTGKIVPEYSSSVVEVSASSEILCSYDPNDKNALPMPYTTLHLSEREPIVYTVRFQNTGNYPADIVRIIDTLSNDLDLSSFRFLASSHPCTYSTSENGIFSFLFEDINLPYADDDEPNSHGYVKFSVRPKSGLGFGDEIPNRAGIYFDFNPPIITNTIVTEIEKPDPIQSTVSVSICNGELVAGVQVFSDTLVTLTLVGADIDTLVTYNVTLLPSSTVQIVEEICQGQSYLFNGETLFNAGTYTQVLANTFGCDSLVVLALFVHEPDTTTTTLEICEGDVSPITGIIYPNAGEYAEQQVFLNQLQCDSFVFTQLIVHPNGYEESSVEVPYGFVAPDGTTVTEPYWYIYHDTTAFGCDNQVAIHYVPGLNATNDLALDVALSLLPNPFGDHFYMRLNLPYSTSASVTIYDLLGRVVATPIPLHDVYSGEINKTIFTQEWQSGVYIVKLKIDDKTFVTKRLVKK